MSGNRQHSDSHQSTIEAHKNRPIEIGRATRRYTAPVFIVGCPRSGTTVLYHMLLSAGGFANYRSETNVFNLLLPKFGGLRLATDRKALLDVWLKSILFRVSGLDPDEIRARIISDCHSGGDFLQIVMRQVARNQGAVRWADCTPEHLLYMQEIKRQIPDALFIHIIRDGRDVALSYVKQGWAHPLPWDRNGHLGVAGLYWEWLVRRGRRQAKYLGADYRELRFEELIARPRDTLIGLGSFIDQDLDYDHIQRAGVGSVSEPNTSFSAQPGDSFDPVDRWKIKMTDEEIASFETLVGRTLAELGYQLSSTSKPRHDLHAARMRANYLCLFAAKHWLKSKTPVGRLVRLERIEIEQ
jgi:hypothetical protein